MIENAAGTLLETEKERLQRKKKKAKRRKTENIIRRIRPFLMVRFPKVFFDFHKPKLPLKIGIYQDIRDACPNLIARQLRLVLHDYTHGMRYLRALCTEGAQRYDLEGNAVGPVTEDEAKVASIFLSKKNTHRTKQGLPPI